jgi:hypothetical protein
MTDLQTRIDDLEKRSAESALIAKLATKPATRAYNLNIATRLQREADLLRKCLPYAA